VWGRFDEYLALRISAGWVDVGEGPRFAGQGLQESVVPYAVESSESLLEFNPTRMCELLGGLPDVNVTAVEDRPGEGLSGRRV
jgi:hypothetical protein